MNDTNKCCEKCLVDEPFFSAMIDAKNNPEHRCPCHSPQKERVCADTSTGYMNVCLCEKTCNNHQALRELVKNDVRMVLHEKRPGGRIMPLHLPHPPEQVAVDGLTIGVGVRVIHPGEPVPPDDPENGSWTLPWPAHPPEEARWEATVKEEFCEPREDDGLLVWYDPSPEPVIEYFRTLLSKEVERARREGELEGVIWATGASSLSEEDKEIFRKRIASLKPTK